jgi:hypothetical protein
MQKLGSENITCACAKLRYAGELKRTWGLTDMAQAGLEINS